MKDFKRRTAVITGGGGGIGRGMALAFADVGMNVVLADIDESAARKVADEVAERGVQSRGVRTDVTRLADLEALAELTYGEFGETNVLCNNAGVSTFEPIDRLRDQDWSWVLDVNLGGVIHGLQAFFARMKAQEGPGYVVNTASIAGLVALPNLAPYTASKFAVVGISETIRAEAGQHDIGCSVLCPSFVDTGIANSERNRPDAYGAPTGSDTSFVNATLTSGLDPVDVGVAVRRAIEEEEFYILTHPDTRTWTEARAADLLGSYDRWEKRSED